MEQVFTYCVRLETSPIIFMVFWSTLPFLGISDFDLDLPEIRTLCPQQAWKFLNLGERWLQGCIPLFTAEPESRVLTDLEAASSQFRAAYFDIVCRDSIISYCIYHVLA
jgi:hypothetical protein